MWWLVILVLLPQVWSQYSTNSPVLRAWDVSARPRGNVPFGTAYYPATSADPSKANFAERGARDFRTRDSRVGFIRKVYSVFMAQMVTTICVTATIMTNYELQQYLFINAKLVTAVALGTSLVAVMSLVSHPSLRYKRPGNLVALGLHTLGQSVLLGVFCSFFNPKTVCLGTMHSLTAFLGITMYTFANPNYDLSMVQTLMYTAMSCMSIGLILGSFFHMPLVDNLWSGISAVLMATFVARDTQAIVRGQGRYNYGQKEYILASLALYQDLYRFLIQMIRLADNATARERRR